MRKLAVVLGICLIGLTGCSDRLHEAEVRSNGMVAEDHGFFWEGTCDFYTKDLVVDKEGYMGLHNHAPVCQGGNSTIEPGAWLVDHIKIPEEELDQIKEVDSITDDYVFIDSIEVIGKGKEDA